MCSDEANGRCTILNNKEIESNLDVDRSSNAVSLGQ